MLLATMAIIAAVMTLFAALAWLADNCDGPVMRRLDDACERVFGEWQE